METGEAVRLPGLTFQDQGLCLAHNAALTVKSLILHE